MVGIRDCTDAVITAAVGDRAFQAGSVYRKQGRVLGVEISKDGRHVEARVHGNERLPYVQDIDINPVSGGGVDIDGSCTCPVGMNCKHVAAALLHARDQAERSRKSAGSLVRIGSNKVGPAPERPAAPRPAPPPVIAKPTLSTALGAWVEGLGQAETLGSTAYPPDVRHRLLYVLKSVGQAESSPALAVAPMTVRLLKDGSLGTDSRPFDMTSIGRGNQPKYVREADVALASRLTRQSPHYQSGASTFLLADIPGALALADILATGRARWQAVDGPALAPGPTRGGRIDWGLDEAGLLRPKLALDGEAEGMSLLRAAPPVWVDPKAGLIGPIDTGLPPSLAAAALAAPPVEPSEAGLVIEALGRKSPGLARFAPPVLEPAEIVKGPPVPHLRLMAARLPATTMRFSYSWDESSHETVGIGRLSFLYGSVEVTLADARPTPTFAPGGRLVQVERDPAAESASVHRLSQLDFLEVARARPAAAKAHARDFIPSEGDDEWLDFFWHDAPVLREEGWRITVDPDFPVQVAIPESGLEAEIREGSGIDWLELDLGVKLDGATFDLIPPLVAMILSPDFEAILKGIDELEPGDPLYVKLADGRLLGLPAERVKPILATLAELLLARGDGKIRLRPEDAAGLAALEAAGLVFRGGDNLRALGRQLRDAGGIPDVTLPETFKAVLRPYQARGVAWLQVLGAAGLGGILADDMGLGKTVQTLAHIAIEKAAGRLDKPALVVAPTSLVANWTREAARFAPDLRVLVLHGLNRHKDFGLIGESDLVVTTYPLLARDHEILEAQDWRLVILDEAQTIKNPEAAMTKMVNRLAARQRLCLTGTPLENHLGELWSLFTFAMPGFLGDKKQFTTAYRTPIEKRHDKERSRMLARRVAPFMLRRTKEAVAADLPEKTEITEPVDFGPEQRDLYETIRIAMNEKVRMAIAAKGFAQSRIIILDALLKLRQVCCDPRLLKLGKKQGRPAGSAKLDRLDVMIDELLNEGRRLLIFSQFTSMLALIEERLREAKIGYSLLTGDTKDRPAAIAAFQDGKVPVFLVSLKAGGVGLNLTAADTVILYDPWWNPAVEDQAIDRVHRIGQTKPVFVHRLVATGTIEEKMELLKERKRGIADAVFDAEGVPTLAMTETDIEVLLG